MTPIQSCAFNLWLLSPVCPEDVSGRIKKIWGTLHNVKSFYLYQLASWTFPKWNLYLFWKSCVLIAGYFILYLSSKSLIYLKIPFLPISQEPDERPANIAAEVNDGMVMRNAFKPCSYSCVVVLAIFGENSRSPGVTIIFFNSQRPIAW